MYLGIAVTLASLPTLLIRFNEGAVEEVRGPVPVPAE
jgi:hypothetical protein